MVVNIQIAGLDLSRCFCWRKIKRDYCKNSFPFNLHNNEFTYVIKSLVSASSVLNDFYDLFFSKNQSGVDWLAGVVDFRPRLSGIEQDCVEDDSIQIELLIRKTSDSKLNRKGEDDEDDDESQQVLHDFPFHLV